MSSDALWTDGEGTVWTQSDGVTVMPDVPTFVMPPVDADMSGASSAIPDPEPEQPADQE